MNSKLQNITLAAFFAAMIAVGFTAYTAVWFSYHDSIYAEACPEQKTVLWCK